jgi:hypothetical protein
MFRPDPTRRVVEFPPTCFVCAYENTRGCLFLLLFASLLTSCAAAGGSSASGTTNTPSTPVAPAASIAVAPQAAIVLTSGTVQFAATVGNLSSPSIQWEVNHVPGGDGTMGTINSAGLYQAPASVPGSTVQVTAVLQTNAQMSASADVTVVPPVSVSPRQTAVTTSQTVQFQALVGGTGGAGVSWSASGGTITAAGLYTPPGAGIFTITATNPTNPAANASATVYVTDFAGQLSWRNDSGLTGQNVHEWALNPATLAAGGLGKISSCTVDGQVHTQPLYVANLAVGGRVRNVIYVATEHDTVYAFDADAIPCQPPLWMTNFLDDANGITTVPIQDIPGGDLSAEVGIAGTPVIDRTTSTLYVIARTKEDGTSGSNYVQRLHALDIAGGGEKFGGPVVVTAAASGNGDGTNSGVIQFDPQIQSQRAAMTLAGGKLYITFSGHSDISGYHGWLLVYDAATLSQVGVFNSTPNGSQGGFSENGAGVSADAGGYVLTATGHGKFDTGSPLSRKNFAQTLLKLQPAPILTIADTFTPSKQSALTSSKSDLGSTGVVILPDQTGTANSHLAIMGGTNGTLYLANRDNLGGFVAAGPDNVIKTISLAGAIFGTPAYWQNAVYVAAAGDAIKAYALNAGVLADAPGSQSSSIIGSPGASPVVSSNGASGGIVWLLDTSGADSGAPAVLHAFDATNLARELYNSSAKPGDSAGPAAKSAVPTVANGKVYVGTQNELTVYGLLP